MQVTYTYKRKSKGPSVCDVITQIATPSLQAHLEHVLDSVGPS